MNITSLDFLNEIHAEIISKGFYSIEPVKIRYYYKAIYNKELNNGCSSCLIDAVVSIKNYYRGAIVRYDGANKEIVKDIIRRLKSQLIEAKKNEQFELCEFIKSRIETNGKLL
jgi:hypothetical protein